MDVKFDFGANDAQLTAAFNKAMSNMDKTSAKAKATSETMKSLGSGMAAYFSFSSAINLAVGAIEKLGKVEQLKVSFETMLGGADAAGKLVTELQALGARTPFEFEDLADGTRKLLAFGFSAEESTTHLQMLGDIAAGSGQNINELASLFGKAAASGRLMGDDLNQLTDRGIPMISMLAEKFGVAETDIRKMTEQGKIGFQDMLYVMQKLTTEGGMFSGAMEKQSETIVGKISTLKDAFTALQVTFVENFADDIKTIVDVAIAGLDKLQIHIFKVKALFGGLGSFFSGGGYDAQERMNAMMEPRLAAQRAEMQKVESEKSRNLEARFGKEEAERIREAMDFYSPGHDFQETRTKTKEQIEEDKRQSAMNAAEERASAKRWEEENARFEEEQKRAEEQKKEDDKRAKELEKKNLKESIENAREEGSKALEKQAEDSRILLDNLREVAQESEKQADSSMESYYSIKRMREEMELMSQFAGRQLAQDLANAGDLGRMEMAIKAFDAAEAGKRSNQIKEARDQKRLEREGEALARELERRKREEEGDENRNRGKGINKKAQEQADRLEREENERKKQMEEDRRKKEQDAKELKAAEEEAKQKLEDIKNNTAQTVKNLEKLSAA